MIDASVEKDNIFACQFHPEKSSTVGLKMLKKFCKSAGRSGLMFTKRIIPLLGCK